MERNIGWLFYFLELTAIFNLADEKMGLRLTYLSSRKFPAYLLVFSIYRLKHVRAHRFIF